MAEQYEAIRMGVAALSQVRHDLVARESEQLPGVFASGGAYRASRGSGYQPPVKSSAPAARGGPNLEDRFRSPNSKQGAGSAGRGVGEAAVPKRNGNASRVSSAASRGGSSSAYQRRDRSVVTATTASTQAKMPSGRTGPPSGRYSVRKSPVASKQGAVRRAGKPAGAAAASQGSPPRLSEQRFNKKVGDPFASKNTASRASPFREAYNAGFPARLGHAGAQTRQTLKWDRSVLSVDINYLLPLCAGGLTETTHPYAFVAKQSFVELVAARPGEVPPLVPSIVRPLRTALGSKNEGVFDSALQCLL